VDAKELVLSFGDNFAPQMPLLRDGYSHFNIGQRPYDMAYTAVKVLHEFVATGKRPEDRIVTGLETCVRETVDACGKTGK
jgi:ribose transport system substrate-binding protein